MRYTRHVGHSGIKKFDLREEELPSLIKILLVQFYSTLFGIF